MLKVFLTLVLAISLEARADDYSDAPMPPPLPEPQEPSYLNPTIYYKPIIKFDVDKCQDEVRVEMLSPEDKVLTRLCAADFNNCVMQGACYVHDEDGRFRSFNYYARGADNIPRFKEVDMRKCPYGYGMRNVCLDPYYTVAADLSIYKIGDVIYVPRLDGAVMPNGVTHDGFFVVRDAGGAIKGPGRFDFYTGFTKPYAKENTFNRMGFANIKNSFPFRMATPAEAEAARQRTGYPGTRNIVIIPPRR